MEICPICSNEADKSNVHVIPWFLIKDCITEGGSGIRDKELSFTIDPSVPTKLYTGRSVLPEKIEEFGDLHEMEREKDNPYSRDKIICSNCEKKLSRLEAIFAHEFSIKKIESFANKASKIGDNKVLISPGYDNSLFELFVQSIFYRCSIGKFDGFTLHPKIEKKIEVNLRKCFSENEIENIRPDQHVNLVHSFPVIVTLFTPYKGFDPTTNFIRIGISRFPYFLVLGKWTFQLFEDQCHLKGCHEYMHGLITEIKPAIAHAVIKEKSHIILLNDKLSKRVHKDLIDTTVEKKIVSLNRNIRNCHVKLFGVKPEPYIHQYIYSGYFNHLKSGKSEFESFVHAFFDLKKLA